VPPSAARDPEAVQPAAQTASANSGRSQTRCMEYLLRHYSLEPLRHDGHDFLEQSNGLSVARSATPFPYESLSGLTLGCAAEQGFTPQCGSCCARNGNGRSAVADQP
jgi:hypothetical protein